MELVSNIVIASLAMGLEELVCNIVITSLAKGLEGTGI